MKSIAEALLTLADRSDNGTDLQVLALFVGSHLQYLYNDLQARYDALCDERCEVHKERS